MNCPKCGKKVDVKSIVDGMLMPPDWSFWGDKGNRFIVCRQGEIVHFRAGNSHRIAVIRK